ncbi:hypothetical protein CRE_29926 [Caenorhabditis remanei]|uniref:Uncharacterized protein n=1 Tax=Caenorhabditis remanei TaxID=31234 RepID=E3MM78_CAERE|nr:hypothetical protein CRE_29926 [Caenorhabditis remanei]
MKNWANFTNGILTIHENLIEKRKKENNQNITCVYTEIIAGEELSNGTFLVQSSKKEVTIEPAIPTRINLEQFVVFCRDPSGYHFYNKTFFNFLPKLEKFSVRESESSNGLIILSVSGMFHNQAMRHLKQSLKFAAENDFISFSMFNQETNNNWGNLMKSFGNKEKIWESVRKINGSPTFLHTDSPKFSKMFGNQFDFHSNLYHNFNRQHFGHVNNCITDGSVTVEDAIDLWINSTRVFKHYSSYFSLLHLTEIAVPEDGKVVNLDEKLRISLEQLLEEGILDSTTVVVISDGGSGNSSVFEVESGKIEAKYGFFMIRLADSFRKKFPQNLEILKNNVDRLITNADVHETFLDLISKWNDSMSSSFGNSLLETQISRAKTCSDSEISDENCICSKVVKHETVKREEILKELLNVVKKEVSMHKCLSKVKINDYGLDFRTFGSINFFKFDGFLVLEQVKISEEYGFSDPIQLKFHGKARFSISDEVHLELRSPLELEEINQTIIQNKVTENCYQNIIKGFRTH